MVFSPVLISFLFGVFFGSFLNVVIDRLSTGRSIVFGRSYCEHCKKTLHPKDLIPLVSYLILGGKCRYCKAKIPFRLFFVELISGITVAGCMYAFVIGLTGLVPAIFLAIILLSFIGIFFADIVYGIIPDALVAVSTVASLFYIVSTNSSLFGHFITGLATLLFFATLFIVTKGKGMGFGDVKLSFVLGFLLGFPDIIVALYLAFLTGAGISIILVVWRKIRFFGGTIPFGPFLVASSVIALFWGNTILLQFLNYF